MYNTSLHYGPYVYPRWGKALGVCMATVSCLQILIWAVVAISKETGTLKEVCVSSPLDIFVSLKPNLWCKLFLSCFFFYCSVSKSPSDLWTPGGSTMPPTVRGWPHRWRRRELTLLSLSLWQTWISMHWRGRWGAKLEAETSTPTSKWQGQKDVTCYSFQQGWWSDFVLQGSVDFWFLFILCIFLLCLYFFNMV